MDSEVRSSPRKARKSMRKQGNTSTSTNQSVSNATSLDDSTPVRKTARKSTGTRSLAANSNQTPQSVTVGTTSSQGISQNTTIPISQPSCSWADSSDLNVRPPRTRNSLSNSLNSTVPLSQPACTGDPDSSDSDVPPTQTLKILKPSINASKTFKKAPALVSSSSGPSTSEESDVEELLKKKNEKQRRAELKASKSPISSTTNNMAGRSLANPDKLVSQCVFYILVANRSKKAIKKRDIIQHVFEGRNSQMFPEILKRAASTLQKIFGMELMELKSNKNEYLLVNNLSHQYGMQDFSEYSRLDHQKNGLIFYILTLIFMNGNSIAEEELWKALDPLGIEIKSRKPHPIFGDVQKFITNTLVKQMYIERRQIEKDPPQFDLYWGERAHKEVLKEDLLDFVCTVMPDTKPNEWRAQYIDAKGRAPEGDAEMEVE